MNELELQIRPLRQHILASGEETVNQFLVALQPRAQTNIGPTRTNIMLVVDDSGSMSGPPIEHVLGATRAIILRLSQHDNLGIVGFADDAQLVHPIVNGTRRDTLYRVTDPYVWAHGRRGYGTNMALGLQRAWDELRRNRDRNAVHRIIVLTDGFASNPAQTLDIAEQISRDGIAIVTLGFGGEFDMGFMDRIAGLSGGACEYIDRRHLDAAIGNFLDQLASIQNQLTDNTRIKLRFRGKHRITDFFQTHPKIIYHGLARLDSDRTWRHRLADVEKKAGLEMLFTVTHPRDTPGRRLVADVEVTYDLPSAGLTDQTVTGQMLIEYGDDRTRFMSVDSAVQRRYNDAFVEKQQTRARQLLDAGQTDKALQVLGTIRKRGDDHVKELAEGTIRKIREQGGVENEQLFQLKMGTQKKSKR